MKTLLLFVITALSALAQLCSGPNFREENGFTRNETTGQVFKVSDCSDTGFSFSPTFIVDFSNVNQFFAVAMKPPIALGNYANASLETAKKVAGIVSEVAPGANPTIWEFNFECGRGPCYSVPMRYLVLYPHIAGGRLMNAGEIANLLMRQGVQGKVKLAEIVERELGGLQRIAGL